MSQHLPNYLRTYRKRTGLTQDELAFLLGTVDGSKVSRHERQAREPSLRTALAYEAALRVPVHLLFRGFYESIEAEVHTRAEILLKRLEHPAPSPTRKAKLLALRALLRATDRHIHAGR